MSVDSTFSGTLLITYPDGNVILVDPGEDLPELLPSGVSVEVFGGTVTISTGSGDSASASCHGTDFAIGGGASVSLQCDEESGKLQIQEGNVTVVSRDGTTHALTEGDVFSISGDSNDLPSTEDDSDTNQNKNDDSLGSGEKPDSTNIDNSRNTDSSVFQ